MVSHLNSFKYVEMHGDFIGTPCQDFEVVPPMVAATKISSDISKADEVVPRMVSLKDSCAVVEDEAVLFGDNFPTFCLKQTSLGWVSPSKLGKRLGVLAWESHLPTSEIMK